MVRIWAKQKKLRKLPEPKLSHYGLSFLNSYKSLFFMYNIYSGIIFKEKSIDFTEWVNEPIEIMSIPLIK